MLSNRLATLNTLFPFIPSVHEPPSRSQQYCLSKHRHHTYNDSEIGPRTHALESTCNRNNRRRRDDFKSLYNKGLAKWNQGDDWFGRMNTALQTWKLQQFTRTSLSIFAAFACKDGLIRLACNDYESTYYELIGSVLQTYEKGGDTIEIESSVQLEVAS